MNLRNVQANKRGQRGFLLIVCNGRYESVPRAVASGSFAIDPLATARGTDDHREFIMKSINSLAVIESDNIGENAVIHEYAIIRRGAKIGNNVVIHPFVIIEAGVTIGNDVVIFPSAYIGKPPRGVGAMTRAMTYTPKTEVGDGCVIGPNAVIYYDVEIGSQTLISDGASIREQSKIGSRCVIGRYVTVNYATLIGDNVKVQDHTWLAGNMEIGDKVFISGGVTTANDNMMGASGYDEESIVGPTIGNGVRIGAGAIILPRVKVGDNALIGAGAVVTKDVPEGQTAKGIPARFSAEAKGSQKQRSE
jgi:UDP-3-O-[3-hydroxymyristoyl] glucosamine N-acyltransferase